MTSTTPDNLKAIYRDKAVLFLRTYRTGLPSSSSIGPCGASEIANSIVVRSLYDTPQESTNIEKGYDCVLSSQCVSVQVQNLIRSGAHNLPVPVKEDEELAIYRTNGTKQLDSSDTINTGSRPKFQYSYHDFYCKCCGNSLLPIPVNNKEGGGITTTFVSDIKLMKAKRGKTRRRRASRYAAKKHVYDAKILQKHKGGGRVFAHSMQAKGHSHSHGEVVASYSRTQVALISIAATRRIGDGMSKNYIRYKCQCGYAMSVKSIRASCQKSQDRQQESLSKVMTRTPVGKDSEDFIQLCLSPSSRCSSSNKATSERNVANRLLNNPRGQKSNRKPSTSSKSKLHDFLSSLND